MFWKKKARPSPPAPPPPPPVRTDTQTSRVGGAVISPEAALTEMSLNFNIGNHGPAERAADALAGWLLHGGPPPEGFTREATMQLIELVRAEAARERAKNAALAGSGLGPRDLVDSLTQEVRRLAAQAGRAGVMDIVLVLDALSEAATRGQLRTFAREVERVKRRLCLP